MRIAVVQERAPGERRVALTADAVTRLVRAGHQVQVERGAGHAAGSPDAAYERAGATLIDGTAAALEGAEAVVRARPPSPEEARALPEGALLVAFLYPLAHLDAVRALARRRTTAFALELVPRITRAQSMDALSSMSTVAGYRAGLLAAQHLGKFFPMLMTAAGTIAPARVVVLGAGVAGLQAIATCRRLGAVVEAYDVREAAREQARSLGAKVIETGQAERGEGEGGYARALTEAEQERLNERLAERVRQADAVITTALIPGRPAPRLIEEATVRAMRPGAVVVDLGAEAGGNCALTRPGETIEVDGVTILGPLDLPATLPVDASRMFAKNAETVLVHLARDEGRWRVDLTDEIDAASVVVDRGEVRHGPTRDALGDA